MYSSLEMERRGILEASMARFACRRRIAGSSGLLDRRLGLSIDDGTAVPWCVRLRYTRCSSLGLDGCLSSMLLPPCKGMGAEGNTDKRV